LSAIHAQGLRFHGAYELLIGLWFLLRTCQLPADTD
jgi:hypothetical protein